MGKKEKKRDYAVIFKGKEHYEVLGFVRASSPAKAGEKALEELAYEARHYRAEKAMVFETGKGFEISFKKKKD